MADDTEAQNTIVPVREATVEFYGDTLIAAEGPDGVILVPLHLLSDAMGLSWPGQRERTPCGTRCWREPCNTYV